MLEKEQEQEVVYQVTAHISEYLTVLKRKSQENFRKGQSVVKQSANLKIKDGNEEALRESSFSVKAFEDQLAILHQIEQRQMRQIKQLEKMENNPYFGRIDLKTTDDRETYYIGLASFSYQNKDEVIDWRTPIASLFYEDHLGKINYTAIEGEEVEVNLVRKRQFIIKDKIIEVMEDTEQTIADEILLKSLAHPSSSHMRQITATIQSEQNKIIRDVHHTNILIQGVAGSGKTAVLLQRLAYLLYSKRSQLDSSQILMFSPNPVFSEYISNVLPSLGEEDIYRTSFDYFMNQFLRHVQMIPMPYEEKYQAIQNFFKSHLGYKAVQQYLETLMVKGLQFTNIRRYDGQLLLSKKDIVSIYRQQPGHTVEQKVSFLSKTLMKFIQEQRKHYETSKEIMDQIDIYGQSILESNEQLFSQLSEKEIENHLRQLIASQMYDEAEKKVKQLSFIRDDLQYLHFILFLDKYYPVCDWKMYFNDVQSNMKAGRAYTIDRLMIVLLKQKIKDNQSNQEYREIMIDEIQDYTPLQLLLITSLYQSAHYTLCGDTNQLILNNEHLLDEMEQLFDGNLKKYYLSKSYRSTAEIVQFADAIIGKHAHAIVPRHGNKPILWTHGLETLIHSLNTECQRIAIITPSEQEAQQLANMYPQWQLIQQSTSLPQKGGMILPINLAKGLEFDTVLITNISKETSDKVLYTMATRAMHELYIVETEKDLLDYWNISQEYYQVD